MHFFLWSVHLYMHTCVVYYAILQWIDILVTYKNFKNMLNIFLETSLNMANVSGSRILPKLLKLTQNYGSFNKSIGLSLYLNLTYIYDDLLFFEFLKLLSHLFLKHCEGNLPSQCLRDRCGLNIPTGFNSGASLKTNKYWIFFWGGECSPSSPKDNFKISI